MGLFDNIGDLAKQHQERIKAGIGKAGDLIDEKTGGKFAGQVDRAQAFATDRLDSITADQATGDQATGDQATGDQATGDQPPPVKS